MKRKFKLLLIVTFMLLSLGMATIVNVSLNFREYSINNAIEKSKMTADIVKDGLTAHMVNGIMDKREYFLNKISKKEEIKSLWITRSQNVVTQYGTGFNNETARDAIDREVLKTGKLVKIITEKTDKILLRVTIPYKATELDTPNCLSCHNVENGATLGAISMEFDITNMRTGGALTILKIAMINILFIIIVLLLLNYYITPYTKLFSNLQDGITKAYKGDFSHSFETDVKGDAKEIVTQMNSLFKKIQENFIDIKNDLGTFVHQDSSIHDDPLYEAKMIISELSDIYKFKKTIELDSSKQLVYSRIVDILISKYKLKHFSLYELNNTTYKRALIHNTDRTTICLASVDNDINLCRAYRTKTDVISSEFNNLCEGCELTNSKYICLPFTINQDFSIILSITARLDDEIAIIQTQLASIKHYLEAAKPVIESSLLMEQLRDSSLKDAMTALYNRRFLDEFIDQIMKQTKRTEDSYHVLMLDVDFFKKVNDTYGHDVGDQVIVKIGGLLNESIRESDLGIRYGGEEFVVLLHNATDEGALEVAKKIHKGFGDLVFEVGNGETMQKTMSIGMAKFPTDGDTIWKCIKFADTALYVAKTTGRDKIVEYSSEMNESDDVR